MLIGYSITYFQFTIMQVKLKLDHPGSLSSLDCILADFPPEALLSRPGLLQAVLDAVGSVHAIDDVGMSEFVAYTS